MNPLNLNPLPSPRSEEESLNRKMEREGFVDEAVITAMIARPYARRSVACPDDLALAADDQDFASWSHAPAAPLRVAEPVSQPEPAPAEISPLVFRAPAPAKAEQQEVQPQQRGSHLWWIAGLACVLSLAFFAAVLFSSTPWTEAPSFKKGTPPTPAPQAETAPLPTTNGQARP